MYLKASMENHGSGREKRSSKKVTLCENVTETLEMYLQ